MADIVCAAEDGTLALAVATGLGVLTAVMDDDVAAICGPKGRHEPQGAVVRHGEAGSVTLGGRRVPVCRPHVSAADRSGELAVPTYEQCSSTEIRRSRQ